MNMADKPKGRLSNFVVWVILGLLILGLAGFGVGNFGGSVSSVAAVGESEVDIDVYGRSLQQELQSASQATGETVSFAQAQALGLDGAVLRRLLATAAFDEATRMAGLSVGDEEVSRQILQIPAFRGLSGDFDRDAYQLALENTGMTVTEFENSIRIELARNLLQGAIVSGVSPLPAYADAIYRYVAERRIVSYAELTEDALGAPVGAPDAAEIQAFYDGNADLFTLPERRAITYAWITPEMLAGTLEADEDALKALYDERRADFIIPPRRMVDRLVFPDDAAAQAAADAVVAGTSTFEDLVAARNLTLEDVDLGTVNETDLEAAGADVFALTDTGVVGPLPTAFGPAIFRVNAILTARETSFEDARAELALELNLAQAESLIENEVDALDDLLAGGATLEDLAAESDLVLEQMNWSGAESEGIATDAAFMQAAATVTADDFPEIVLMDNGGLFALRLDSVLAPSLQPFEDVADAAADLAADKKLRDALSGIAEELRDQLGNGTSFEDLELLAITEPGLTRRDFVPGGPDGLTAAAFDMAEGEAIIMEGASSLYLVRMDGVLPPDGDDQGAEMLRTALTQEANGALAQDILTQFAQSIEAEVGITINQPALNAVHSQLP